jgi:hypothetical protein
MIIIADLPDLPPSLETLFLLGNRFEEVPTSVSRLPALRMLSFKDCRLRRIGVPLPAPLKWLILTGACDSATSHRSRGAHHGNHTLRCLLRAARSRWQHLSHSHAHKPAPPSALHTREFMTYPLAHSHAHPLFIAWSFWSSVHSLSRHPKIHSSSHTVFSWCGTAACGAHLRQPTGEPAFVFWPADGYAKAHAVQQRSDITASGDGLDEKARVNPPGACLSVCIVASV